jgi:ribonuclease P protein component
MLPKSQRLTTEEFLVVMEKGRVTHSPLFLMRIISGMPATKFAAVAPKKVAKTAVERNKIRRQTYDAIGICLPRVKTGTYAAVFAKEAGAKADRKEMVADIEKLFVKAGILK